MIPKLGQPIVKRQSIRTLKRSFNEFKGDSFFQNKSNLLKPTEREDPFKRTGKILHNDMRIMGQKMKSLLGFKSELQHDLKMQFFPTHTDIVIIGGGVIGSSIAYWLKQRVPQGFDLIVVEKNPEDQTSYALTSGVLQNQFCLPENVEMSLFGAEFLKNIDRFLHVDGYKVPNVLFYPSGFLNLAGEKHAETLESNSKLHKSGILLSPQQINRHFPWINTKDVVVGCWGVENQGWFDPYALTNAFKTKSINLGTEYIEAEVVGFEILQTSGVPEKMDRVVIKLPNGEIKAIHFGICILAAGPNSGDISRMAGIGGYDGLLSFCLPVEPRTRIGYSFYTPEGPTLPPIVSDPSGIIFRRKDLEGNFITWLDIADNTNIDNFFNQKIKPILVNRVPNFKNLKLGKSWEGKHSYNYIDGNGVLGCHPFYQNLYIACGFSNFGFQHAPAVGRGIMELILDGEFKSIDLSRLGYERLCFGEPLQEKALN